MNATSWIWQLAAQFSRTMTSLCFLLRFYVWVTFPYARIEFGVDYKQNARISRTRESRHVATRILFGKFATRLFIHSREKILPLFFFCRVNIIVFNGYQVDKKFFYFRTSSLIFAIETSMFRSVFLKLQFFERTFPRIHRFSDHWQKVTRGLRKSLNLSKMRFWCNAFTLRTSRRWQVSFLYLNENWQITNYYNFVLIRMIVGIVLLNFVLSVTWADFIMSNCLMRTFEENRRTSQ